ncbi:MAG: xanthine dehydrogenase family protein molybdopterin-binding subunit, partial [Alphaproteobacteria bacterium]
AGAYICEVEIDPQTGTGELVSFHASDDFGTIINPMIVEGQVHGGLVQGIGQALMEHCVYDADGQLMSGSLLDYCMPRADDVPFFSVDTTVTPCTHNPLGAKGCGEAGAIGAPPAVINAIINAIDSPSVSHIDMPASPERVWKALQSANLAQAAQ